MSMIKESTLKFLKDLKKNNDRSWMEKNKQKYTDAKADFELLVANLIKDISKFDSTVSSLEVKDCTFRLYRDVRFSKDKSPYKTNMGASFNPGGKKQPTPGYYIHIEPGQSFVAGGLWMPEPVPLARLRQEIDYNYDQWKSIISSPAFKKYFPHGMDKADTLQRPPKGYEVSNPAIEFLKLKSFTTRHFLSDKDVTDPKTYKTVLDICKAIKPLLEFINHGIVE
jgi:uncharacterized protein (TIGR02453 family)